MLVEDEDRLAADYWNQKSGESGDAYHVNVLDPAMLGYVRSFSGKVVLDVGCGNGYLARRCMEAGAQKVICVDKSEHSVRHAIQNNRNNHQIVCFVQDINTPWYLPDDSIDIILSNMVLHQVGDLQNAQSEAFRVLRPGGEFVFSITHPSLDLCAYIEEQFGKHSQYLTVGGYYEELQGEYVMRSDSSDYPDFRVPHFHRTLSTYFNTTMQSGFYVLAIDEPPVNEAILANNPRFAQYKDRPASLVFYAVKP